MEVLQFKSKRDRNGWAECVSAKQVLRDLHTAAKDDTFLNNLPTYMTYFSFWTSDECFYLVQVTDLQSSLRCSFILQSSLLRGSLGRP